MALRFALGEHFGPFCVAAVDGEDLYARLLNELAKPEAVVLDFAGVTGFASPFFNAAIGKLLKDFSPDELRELVFFENLTPGGIEVVRRVIENARSFYENSKAREALESSLSTLSEG